MTTTATDRLFGLNTAVAVKAPVRAVSTANLTLSGLQTVGGVVLVADDRVLVKDQTDATENGIYLASSSAWQRAADFDGSLDVVQGTLIVHGTDTTLYYRVTSANPITPGTSSISFEVVGTAITAASIGATLYPATATEGATVVREHYPYGNLKRYTANNGDGSDISAAFEAMLACGEKYCFVPAPTSTWGIATQVDWVSGVSVYCGLGTSFTSSRASGLWAFVFDGVPYAAGATFEGFLLNITNAGARGIQIWESRNVHIDRFEILGPAGIGGYGIEINGGDDASPTYGAAHNSVTRGRAYRMAAGIRLYTDNTTTPASTTAFANRNYIAAVQAQSCTEGLFMDRANTNQIHMSLQANTEGADIGQYAKNNTLNLIPENNTRQIVLHTSADDNLFMGTVQPTDFVDSGGSAVDPHVTTYIVSSNNLQLPRDVVLCSGGSLRLSNPYDSGPMRMRAGDTYDQNLIFGSHDASDTNFDLLSMVYHATSPYASALRALTRKRTALTYSTSIDTDASLGNFFDITVTDGVAFTINAPTIPVDGHEITYTIRNASGGAVGAITWNAVFKLATLTNPANGFSRSVTFRYNGTNWVQIAQTGVDVPN